MDIVIYSHPDPKNSHNAAVLSFVQDLYKEAGKKLDIIDLYKEGFSPLLTLEEYSEEKISSDIKKYQNKIMQADILIFIFPIWWYGPPAILKGFFDRVFTSGFAYNFKRQPRFPKFAEGVIEWLCLQKPLYPFIVRRLPVEKKLIGKKALIVNTFGGNKAGYNLFGRAVENMVDKGTLEFCGISPIRRINWFEARGPNVVPPQIQSQIKETLMNWW
ncbi:MAG: NAD(P)H-dependent oxidoreductase [Candidatus Micrarchaeota archaeon]|nr:NAD(P)H-dependent oxidoreductase [Candidatus Micrarchaeota archaeon]